MEDRKLSLDAKAKCEDDYDDDSIWTIKLQDGIYKREMRFSEAEMHKSKQPKDNGVPCYSNDYFKTRFDEIRSALKNRQNAASSSDQHQNIAALDGTMYSIDSYNTDASGEDNKGADYCSDNRSHSWTEVSLITR